MESVLTFVWLGAAVVLGVIEAASPMLVCVWFCAGAVCAFAVSFFTSNLFVQLAVFAVASLAGLLALRPLMRRRVAARAGDDATDVDALVGRTAVVTQAVPAGGEGRALLGDTSWIARCDEGVALASGQHARVAAVDGTRLVLEPAEDPVRA